MGKKEKKIDTIQSVELGDGVEILLRVAGPYVRAMALCMDYLILIAVLVVLSIGISILSLTVNHHIGAGVMLLCLFVLAWGYFSFFESGKRGATPGKRMMGIRVVDNSGNSASRSQVFVRNIFRFVDMLPGLPSASAGIMIGGYGAGLLTCFLSRKFQRIGDLIAKTVVVYSKPVNMLAVAVPPALEAVAPAVALTREEQAAIAAFRERAGLWSEARRVELAEHASVLTRKSGEAGMTELLSIARWLTDGK